MVTVNKNYLKLPGSYLFSTIAKKVAAYQAANPDVEIVRLGIGDVTQPLVRRSLMHFTNLSMRWQMPRLSTAMHRISGTNS